jgi:hypothetical protein
MQLQTLHSYSKYKACPNWPLPPPRNESEWRRKWNISYLWVQFYYKLSCHTGKKFLLPLLPAAVSLTTTEALANAKETSFVRKTLNVFFRTLTPSLLFCSAKRNPSNWTQFYSWGTHGHAVAGSSPDELDFFNLPNPSSRTVALGSTQTLTDYQESSWLMNVGRHLRLTTYHHLWADCLENVGASTSHNHTGLHGLLEG